MRRSYIWAALFTLAVGGWFASGELMPLKPDNAMVAEADSAKPASQAPFRVQVARLTAEPRQRHITLRGYTEASRRVEARARTQGIVVESPFSRGDAVDKGDLLCRLDMAARSTQHEQAKAELASAERDYAAAEKLKADDFVSASKLAAERARLDLARVRLEQIEQEIGWTEITAPVAGVLTETPAEIGSYLQPGAVCAALSVLDPLFVVGQIGERDVAAVTTGMPASARLATGETVEGTIRFIAPSADLATRTFRIELEVANPDLGLREGVTAELVIPLPDRTAHRIPSSALTLADDGRFGVRLVGDDNRVAFQPVTLIAQDRDGAWVAGLPDPATVIVVGQDFVTDGQTVEPVFATAEAR